MTMKRVLHLQAMTATIRHLQSLVQLEEDDSVTSSQPARAMQGHIQDMIKNERRYQAWMTEVMQHTQPRLNPATHESSPPEDDSTLEHLVETFTGARKETLTYLTDLAPEDWQRTAIHPQVGEITFHQLVGRLTLHDRHHLKKLRSRVAAGTSSPDSASGTYKR